MLTLVQALDINTDPYLLAQVLARGEDDDLSQHCARNPSCPPEVLSKVLSKGNNDWVSYEAVQNPSCPIEALIETLEVVGHKEIAQLVFEHSTYKKYLRDGRLKIKQEVKEEYKQLEANWKYTNPISQLEL